jgi:hypothetical protein
MVLLGCDEKRRRVVFRPGIHIDAARQECPHFCQIPAFRRLHEAQPARIGRERSRAAEAMEHEKDGSDAPQPA